jgi:aryl sulfotransferase
VPSPQRTRVYQNHHLDSTRWDAFVPRAGDIVIATTHKTGTTWMQAIVAHLLFPSGDFPAPPWQMSPWLELRTLPLTEVLSTLERQSHRRFIKTHLPADGLPFFPEAKYVFVGRDGRDVFMSLWNHYANYTRATLARFNETPGRVGDPIPPAPADLHQFWREWCTRGWFAWQTDGWPFWSHLYGTQSWWEARDLPNVAFIHHADLTRDLNGSIGRLASFLDIPASNGMRNHVAGAVTFEAMKRRGDDYAPSGGWGWKGGADTFLKSGTNGRWRDVLSGDELALYDAAVERTLSPDCRAWLEHGGPVSA